MSSTVVVTGGAGYIGSHVCKQLHRAGFTPVTFDNLETGHAEAVRWGPLEVGDLRRREQIDEVLERHRPLAVMHFAAYTDVGESVRNPRRYYRNNVVGSLNLVDAMVEHGIDRLVFSSTCATYGVPSTIPIAEDHPQDPINAYGATKLAIERLIRDYEVAHGLRAVILRYFNAAGADPDGDLGELHVPETHLLPLVLEAAAGERPSLQIYGDRYPTRDGSCVRDFVHVTDLADAHVRALRHLIDSGTSAALNLGTGVGSSVLEVVEQVREVTGREVPTVLAAPRDGDAPELVAAPGRAEDVLGWRPRCSDLPSIVADAWRWRSHRG